MPADPGLPRHRCEAGLRALRETPDAVAGVGVREIMESLLTDYVGKLDTAPIIMGHSLGGNVRPAPGGRVTGWARPGCRSTARPSRASTRCRCCRRSARCCPALDNPANVNRASVGLTAKQFHYAFTNAPGRGGVQGRLLQQPSRRQRRPKVLSRAASRWSPRTRRHVQLRRRRPGPLLFISAAATSAAGGPAAQLREDAKHSSAIAAPSCSPAGTTTPAGNPVGKPSPTSPSTGPSLRSRVSGLTRTRECPAGSRRPGGAFERCARSSPGGLGEGGELHAMDTPSLLKDRYKCAQTVRGDTNRRAAILGLVRPSAASRTTCRSEGDRLDSASAARNQTATRPPAAHESPLPARAWLPAVGKCGRPQSGADGRPCGAAPGAATGRS